MQNQLQSFLKGVDQAACTWFGQYGGALDTIGFALAVTPEPLSTKVGVGLMLANAAAEKGCIYSPDSPVPGPGSTTGVNGCYKVDGPGADLVSYFADGTYMATLDSQTGYIEILAVTQEDNNTKLRLDLRWQDGSDGWIYLPNYQPERGAFLRFDLRPGVNCLGDKDDSGDKLNPEDVEPITYVSEDNGCEMNITFKGYAEGPAGEVYQITQIEPANSSRNSGGIISGCFFNPTIVVNKIGGGGGGGNEPPITIPVPSPTPAPGDPWWQPYVQAALGGIVAGATEELIENILNQAYPSMLYRAVSVCEKDADGEPISEAVEIPIASLKAPDAQIARLDAIVELLQAHKNFKQPICEPEKTVKPPLEGQWVTTRWISDETMDHSGRRLRKLFRYRSKSTRDLGQLSAYWENFEWNAGPVCVFHTGAWWGDPQVWAESEEEGRRVIRFAAGEAGIDPDQVGEWRTSSSRSPRYGMSGTMKILRKEGFPWVASRDGAEWPNMLALQRDP